jgi:hypothetical protein
MGDPVIAAAITSGVTLLGLLVHGVWITRSIDKKRVEDAKGLEQIKADLALQTQKRLAEIEAEVAARQKFQDGRRTAIETILNASSIARSAAKHLLDHSANQSAEDRIRAVSDSLQKMSQFFEQASASERNLQLIEEDVARVKAIQADLVKMLLLLDLDRDENEYWERLQSAFDSVTNSVEQFQSYVRSATAP